MSEFDCYKCRYRGEVPGSCHSRCRHPEVEQVLKSEGNGAMLEMLAIFAGVGRVPPMTLDKLGIKTNPRGVAGGWCNWPWNFDPVWLENCKGYEPKAPPTADNDEGSTD